MSETPALDLRDADDVVLTVPAQADFVRVVRLTAAGLATRLGFTYDEIEDVKIAVDEACHVALGSGHSSAQLSMRFSAAGGRLTVEGMGPAPVEGAPRLNEWSERILESVTDEYGVEVADGSVRFRLVRSHHG